MGMLRAMKDVTKGRQNTIYKSDRTDDRRVDSGLQRIKK